MRAWFLVVGLTLTVANGNAEEVLPTVGNYGHPSRVTVRGGTTFSEAEIVEALFADLDVANAAYPTAPLNEFQRVLADKTLAGHQIVGFADATVDARLDEELDKLVLTVFEGPRYLAGEIEISGLSDADASWLRNELMSGAKSKDAREPSADKSSFGSRTKTGEPWWCVGKPAFCDQTTLHRTHRLIEDRLLKRGVQFAEFAVATRLDRNRRIAMLKIAFTDAGQPATLDEIVISGDKANSREDILAYLGLTPGMAVKGDLRSEIAEKLAQSGRFVTSKVKITNPKVRGERLILTIELSEYEKAPLLREPLSREEESLVKLSRWLSGFDHSAEEILMTAETPVVRAELVVAPRLGMVLMLRKAKAGKETQCPPFALALAVDDNGLSLCSTKRKCRFHLQGVLKLLATLNLKIHNGPPKLDAQGTIAWGLGVGPWASRPLRLDLKFKDTAVGMLSLAHEYQSRMSWDENTLIVAYKAKELRLNGVTGQLVSARSEESKVPIEFARCVGEFDRRVREIERVASNYPNVAEVERPLTGLFCFACSELADWLPENDQELLQPLRRLLELGLLQPVDRFLTEAHPVDTSGFSLPSPLDLSSPFYAQAYLANGWLDSLVPRGSWAERLAREALFVATGKSRHLHEELARQLSSRDAGPLRFLGVVTILHMVGQTRIASDLAQSGMLRATEEGFLDDCECLLDATLPVGQFFANAVAALGQLNESEVEILCRSLVRTGAIAEASREKLAACLANLLGAAEPRERAMRKLLVAAWKVDLRDRVQQALCQIAGPARTYSEVFQINDGAAQEESKGAGKGKTDDIKLFTPLSPFGSRGKRRNAYGESVYR